MSIHQKPIEERIKWLLDLAQRHTAEFRSPEACLARELYLVKHPTAIVVLKCMDGRINIPIVTCSPPGILQPFRNLGGMFNLGWPHLGEVLVAHVQRKISEGRRVLMLITYHFSRGDVMRGCAGFNYDTSAAINHCREIKRQAEYIFGAGRGTVYPVICGFETDEDALLIHGNNDEILDLSTIAPDQVQTLGPRLQSICADMPEQVHRDLVHLLEGNLKWIGKIRTTSRTLDTEHREWMICLGRGFDFLHTPNHALIIGSYSPNLADPIGKATSIIESNMAAGRIPDDGFLLFASVPFEEIGMDRARTELKSQFLANFAADVIRRNFPQMADRMHIIKGVLSWRSRALELLP